MWAIRNKKTDRYYIGEEFLRLYDDYCHIFGQSGDSSKAERFNTQEAAGKWIESISFSHHDYEVVELVN